MGEQSMTNASLTIPAENYELVAALVAKLGGRLQADDDELITAEPMAEDQRPGRMLKGLRHRAELSQKDLARAIGVPQSHISEYEKNKRRIPEVKANALAKLLKTVPSNFLPK